MRYYGDPVLRKKAEPIAAVTEETAALIAGLFDTMYREKGVGLAAPQVGRSARVFVVDVEDDAVRVKRAFVNPVITHREGTMVGEEGCLSIPGFREDVKRWARVTVEALDERGQPFTLEVEGLPARAIQHELDHLDGILFIDRLSPIRRKLLEARLKRFKAPEANAPAEREGSRPSL
ncbi:MAG: peptide deformylase [Hyphomicrobiales bacterium]